MSDATKKDAPRVVAAPVSAEVVEFARREVARLTDPYTGQDVTEVAA